MKSVLTMRWSFDCSVDCVCVAIQKPRRISYHLTLLQFEFHRYGIVKCALLVQ